MPAMREEKTNPCLVLSPDKSFHYEARNVPRPRVERDVIVQIIATGICGSDVHYWQHGGIGQHVVDAPLILGHESAGVVVECGSAVESLQPGDRVALEPGIACNHCELCRQGRYNLCARMQFAATPPYDGTFAKYYCVPEECCFKLPMTISLRDAALTEPLSVALHCCRLAGDMQGKSVIIFGAGAIGQLCCSVAVAFGCEKVIVVDILEERLVIARSRDATHTYRMMNASAADNATALLATAAIESGGDIVIDATGAETCIGCGIHALKSGGILVQAGLGKPNIEFPVGLVCDKEATVKGSFRYGPGDFKLAVSLLASRRVRVSDLVTHEFEFDEAGRAFETVGRREGIKSIVYGPGVDARWAKEICSEV